MYRQKVYTMEQHRTIDFEGRQLHYRDEGRENSTTLVLLHGFLQSLDVWSSFTLSYMRNIRVIAIDLPGHGYSSSFNDIHSMEFMARAVDAVLKDADVDQCVMVGHSLGGYVALAYADANPYRLRGLGLLHSHALADTEHKKQLRQQDIQQVNASRPGYIINFLPTLFDSSKKRELEQEIKDLQEQCLDNSTQGITAALRGMAQRPSRIHVLENLNVPILFVYGKNDSRLPLELGLSQAMLPKHSEIMILDNVAHMSHIEERDYVKLRLLNFVNTCCY